MNLKICYKYLFSYRNTLECQILLLYLKDMKKLEHEEFINIILKNNHFFLDLFKEIKTFKHLINLKLSFNNLIIMIHLSFQEIFLKFLQRHFSK
jgi:hypothetical protein